MNLSLVTTETTTTETTTDAPAVGGRPRKRPGPRKPAGERKGARRGQSKTPGLYFVPGKRAGQRTRLIIDPRFASVGSAEFSGAIPAEHDTAGKRPKYIAHVYETLRARLGVHGKRTLTSQALMVERIAAYVGASMSKPSSIENAKNNLARFSKWATERAASDDAYAYAERYTQSMLGEYVLHLQTSYRSSGAYRKLSIETIDYYCKHVRAFFYWLREKGNLPNLYEEQIHNGLRHTPKGVKRKRKVPRVWSTLEIRTVLTAAMILDAMPTRKTSIQVAPQIIVGLLGGFRRDEQHHVKGTDVAEDLAEITVRVSKVLDEGETATVEVAGYSVILRELLQMIRANGRANETLFPCHAATMDQNWRALRSVNLHDAEACGLPALPRDAAFPVDTSFKTARATCATFQQSLTHIGPRTKASRQLHSEAEERRAYIGRVKVPHQASTLEEAMGCEDLMRLALGRYVWRDRARRRR